MRAPIAILLVALCSVTRAGDIATERTQVATSAVIVAISQINDAIEGFTQEIRDFEERAQELLDLRNLADVDALRDLFEIYEDIAAVIQEGDAMAHNIADLETWFRERFETYEDYYRYIEEAGEIDEADVLERVRRWQRTHRSTIENTLQAHGIQAAEIDTAEERLALLQRKSRNAEGRMQALQVGQEIATEQIKQLHGLKEILMEQSNLHASYFAAKVAMEADAQAQESWLHRELGQTILGNGVGARLP